MRRPLANSTRNGAAGIMCVVVFSTNSTCASGNSTVPTDLLTDAD